MSFLAPQFLLGLLAIPALLWLYWRARRAKAEGFVWMPGLELARQAQASAGPGRFARRFGVGLYAAALALGLVALARPQVALPVPVEQSGVVLVLDVSYSMEAKDIAPSRLSAAKKAAHDFVNRLPKPVRVGLVSFSDEAVLEAPLTQDRAEVLDRIGLLDLRGTTAIGKALLTGISTFTSGEKVTAPSAIILLSDGRNMDGLDPREAALEAKRLGVVVHTIGVGSANPAVASRITAPTLQFDEEELQAIAEATGGRYFRVDSAEAFDKVYGELGRQVSLKVERTEVSSLITLLAGLMLAGSLLTAQLSRRVM